MVIVVQQHGDGKCSLWDEYRHCYVESDLSREEAISKAAQMNSPTESIGIDCVSC